MIRGSSRGWPVIAQAIAFFLLAGLQQACQPKFHVQKAHYSPQYIADHAGKSWVEVPPVQELVHIAMAITPTGLADSNLVDHATLYYQEVQQNFGSFARHKLILDLEKLLQNGKYARLKMNSCGYVWQDNRLYKDPNYEVVGWENKDYIAPLKPLLEDFAQATHFQDFYHQHQTYYDSLMREQRERVPVSKPWRWLEKQFPARYDAYRITFSPLVNGSHSTARFEGNGFKETIMFICPPFESKGVNDAIQNGLLTRIIFTEIDHNYVNPVTEQYLSRINEAFSDRSKWTKEGDTDSYGSAYAVFNEYMTWSVFNLYCYEHYKGSDFQLINERTEKQVGERRGFYRFAAFNAMLLKLYQHKKASETIADLYPQIIANCQNL